MAIRQLKICQDVCLDNRVGDPTFDKNSANDHCESVFPLTMSNTSSGRYDCSRRFILLKSATPPLCMN